MDKLIQKTGKELAIYRIALSSATQRSGSDFFDCTYVEKQIA